MRSSIKPDYIVCLEDGKKQKMLKRHLMTSHGMTPAEYREKWGLAADYPMVAPNYAEQRRSLPRASAWAPSAARPADRPRPSKPQEGAPPGVLSFDRRAAQP